MSKVRFILPMLIAVAGPAAVSAQGLEPVVASAATAPSRSSWQPSVVAKDPGTATLLSAIVPGAGQLYSGALNRGLVMLGGAYGSLIIGAVLSSGPQIDYVEGGFPTVSDGTRVPFYLGALAATGIWIYGIVDAAPTARRMNAARGLTAAVAPVVRVGSSGERQFGLRVRF